MEYAIYKFDFQTGVHFGTGMLNESTDTFLADQLFSALYIEAVKMKTESVFLQLVKKGQLCFSDAFPYIEKEYLLPKPMLYIETAERGKSEQKKAYKKLKYVPVDRFDEFINGTMDIQQIDMDAYKYGTYRQQTMAEVRITDETQPYRVGTFYFSEGCGLYIIAAYENEEGKAYFEELLESLSYTGIGGKKYSGLGKFMLRSAKMPELLNVYLQKDSSRKMLLSVALPKDDEMERALEGASYQLSKRSGFIASAEYADEWRKKKDLYVLCAGSCFKNCFEGDIYDVSQGGSHPVFRYAKPLFIGV